MKNHAKTFRQLVVLSIIAAAPLVASAQWVVTDPGNLIKNSITAAEQIKATAKQLQQYQKQLQQLENQIRNTTAPPQFLWDEANYTIKRIVKSIDTLNYYKQQAGSVDAYMKANFGTVNDYASQKCFSSTGCSAEEWKVVQDRAAESSNVQARSTEAMLRGLDEQQEMIQADANKLVQIQSGAQGAQGQLAAMGYANQLASAQVNQLLQLRTLMIAQQAEAGIRQRALQDQEAKQQAASRQLHSGESTVKSPKKVW